ncbi:hypothetical protein STEG23_000283 [Scotinomys teguina]
MLKEVMSADEIKWLCSVMFGEGKSLEYQRNGGVDCGFVVIFFIEKSAILNWSFHHPLKQPLQHCGEMSQSNVNSKGFNSVESGHEKRKSSEDDPVH